jgi:predicted DNA-binding protein (MmcQ/YjbR family)
MKLEALAKLLRKHALGHPETYEEAPWGDRVVKVRGKIFFLCGVHAKQLYVTVKLPATGRALLQRPYAEPTHYGMGKHGWVTSKFNVVEDVPQREVEQWIDESFRAIAPKKLSAMTDAMMDDDRAAKKAARPKANRPASAKADGERAASALADPSAKAATKRPTPKRPARRKPTSKLRAVKAVLFCLDPMRAERAVAALAARSIGCAVRTDASKLALGRARVLIVDVGRQPGDGLALAARIDASDAAVHLFVAGVRDAAQARQLRALGSAESFRVPPGDDSVADAVARALANA